MDATDSVIAIFAGHQGVEAGSKRLAAADFDMAPAKKIPDEAKSWRSDLHTAKTSDTPNLRRAGPR